MPAVRRLYLYLVSLVSLLAFMAGLIGFGAGAAGLWVNADPWQITGTELAHSDLGRWAALALVSLPLWAIHWFLANRTASTLTIAGAVERRAAARKAYFYVARLGALLAMLVQAGLLLDGLLLAVLGDQVVITTWPVGPVGLAAGTLVALAFWLYLRWITQHDGDVGHEPGVGASWRRAYDYLAAFVGTIALVAGAAEFLRVVLGLAGEMLYTLGGLPPAAAWLDTVAAGLAAMLLGGPLAWSAWRRANWIAADDPTGGEVNSLGRKLLLYAGLLAGVAGAVLSAAYVIMAIVLMALGQPVDDLRGLWTGSLAPALAYYAVGRMVWWAFGRAVRNDVAWAPESPDAGTLRRLYFYLMAALTLAAFWYGLQQTLVTVLAFVVGAAPASALSLPGNRYSLALAAALLTALGPAWWWHWRRAQAWARQPGPAGAEERASTLRRLYLYGAALAAAGVVIVTLGIVIYRAPGWLLGPRTEGGFAGVIVQLGVAVAVALTWWIGHGLVMREDARLAAEDAAEEQAVAEYVAEQEGPAAEPGPEPWQGEAAAPQDWQPEPPGWRQPAGDLEETPPGLAARQYDRAALPPAAGQAAGRPRHTTAAAGDPEGTPPGLAARQYDRAGLRAGGLHGGRPGEGAVPGEPAPGNRPAVVVMDGAAGTVGALLLAQLRRALPGVLLWPIGLNETAQAAMEAAINGYGAPAAPPDALERARAIVGPGDIMVPGGLHGEMPPELAAMVAESPARKVLLPPADPRFRWAGAPVLPLEDWVRQAVSEVEGIIRR